MTQARPETAGNPAVRSRGDHQGEASNARSAGRRLGGGRFFALNSSPCCRTGRSHGHIANCWLNGGRLDFLQYGVSPKDFFDSEALDYPCLCKFKGRLTPEEMSEDIDFAIEPDQTPYREHIVRW